MPVVVLQLLRRKLFGLSSEVSVIDKIKTHLGRFCRDRHGTSAIEFAIIAPVMLLLMLGAYDLGNRAQQEIQLQQAVRSGGLYAAYRPTDVSGIQTSVSDALPTGWSLNSPATVVCGCVAGAAFPSPSCTAANLDTCTGAGAAKLVTITATMSYAALMPQFASTNTAIYVTLLQ